MNFYLTYLFLIMLEIPVDKHQLLQVWVDQRHGFLSKILIDCNKVIILCNPLIQAQHL